MSKHRAATSAQIEYIATGKWAMERLTRSQPRGTQADLERRLGLSVGYLCRVKKGTARPSKPLISLLVLLANDEKRIGELPK